MPNRTELNTSSSRRTALELFFFFCKKFGSIESNRNDQLSIIYHLHHLNASYSVHFEVEKLRKISGTVRRDNLELVRFDKIRFQTMISMKYEKPT